jgi:hypothetical protein
LQPKRFPVNLEPFSGDTKIVRNKPDTKTVRTRRIGETWEGGISIRGLTSGRGERTYRSGGYNSVLAIAVPQDSNPPYQAPALVAVFCESVEGRSTNDAED